MSVNKLTQARAAVGSLLIGSTSGKSSPAAVSPIELAGAYLVSAAVTPTASLLANTTYQGTVTITGVQPGDAIIAIPPTNLEAGLGIDAWVSAANTLKVTVQNVSAGTVTTTVKTWQFLWIKLAPNN